MAVRVLLPGEPQPPPSTMQVIDFLARLGPYYPHIMRWYQMRVMPGLKDGTRKLFYRQNPDTGALLALGIAKKTLEENKICSLRVVPEAQGAGIGFELTRAMLCWMEDDNPHFTIASDKTQSMGRWIDTFGWKSTSAHAGLYVPDKTEIFYNE